MNSKPSELSAEAVAHKGTGLRLRELEAENARLADVVVMTDDLYSGLITRQGEQDYASEVLHVVAEELRQKYPRLSGK
ncbi:hypothetical protein [Streptomyces sp. NPDC054838]